MGTRRFGRFVSSVIGVVLVVAVAERAAAEPPRAPGANTGDGSTPFTGLAQAPEANLFVGAATTAIPIEVPPGRQSLTPKLALVYSSSAGPGPYGYGWDLHLGKIQRSTKHGVLPCNGGSAHENDFVLVLPGSSVECTLNGSDNRCYPAVEEAFLRIQYAPADNHWEAWDKSGIHYFFGQNQAARSPVFPDCYTFAWALTHIEDPNRNALDVTYLSDGYGSYPDTLQYGGHPFPHVFEVNFVWSDEDGFARPAGDQIINSMGGFPATLTRLLSRIEVRYPIGGPRVRWYSFEYESQTDAPDRLGRQSFLSAVTLFDDSDRALSRADGLPAATTFLYHETTPGLGFSAAPQGATRPTFRTPHNGEDTHPGTLRWTDRDDGTRRDVLDMNGDGFPDLVDAWPVHEQDDGCSGSGAADSWDVYFGSAAGFAAAPVSWAVPFRGLMCDLDRKNATATWLSTADVTGDGIPDFIDARATPWMVYPGTAHSPYSPAGTWGFDVAQPWPAPLANTQVIEEAELGNPGPNNDWQGNAIVQDLLDMNGDGRLDLVRTAGPGGNTVWRVWPNTGTGFGAEEMLPASTNAIAFLSDDDGMVLGTFDINGDGLPDTVLSQRTRSAPYSGYWEVWLHSGHAINWYQQWSLPAAGSWRHIRKSQGDPLDTVRDFIDINGDGLPDVVDRSGWSTTNRKWQVFLNRGAGFAPQPALWEAPVDRLRCASSGGGQTFLDIIDVDGDGLVDFVDFSASPYRIYHAADGAWSIDANGTGVVPNPNGSRPDVLEQMENGIGGTTRLEYRPSTQWNNTDLTGIPRLPLVLWTLTHIERDDGLCDDADTNCLSAGSHTLSTDLTYGFGLFEPVTREFRGFRTVEEADPDGNLRTTWFHQDAARKGKIQYANVYAAGANPYDNLLVYTVNDWQCASPTDGQLLDCPAALAPAERRWVQLREEDRYDTTNSFVTKLAFTKQLAWDAYGNVAALERGGTGTTRVDTYTQYAVRDDAAGYVVDRPSHVRVLENNLTPLEEKWFAYDALPWGGVTKGDMTTVFTWLDRVIDPLLPVGASCPQAPASGVGTCVTTQMQYDSYGALTTVVDANGNLSATTYDSATHIYPFTVANGSGQAVATTYDPACGKLLWQTVMYPDGADPMLQPRSTYAYDSFCRPAGTALPGESLARPHRRYLYFLGAPQQATDVRTIEAVAGSPLTPTRWVTRDDLFDGLGRRLQTLRDAVVEGKRTAIADGTVEFDARGNAATTYTPFALVRAYNRGAVRYGPPPPTAGATQFDRDALNRLTRVISPDGSARALEHNVAWQATTKDECYTSGTCLGSKTIEKRDAFGRVTETQVYRGDVFETRTGSTYDGLGRLITTTQGTTLTTWATNTTITLTYDSLGRKIQLIDPDSGTWRYGYDRVGNLLYQDDPATSQHLEFCYDALNRVTDKFYKTSGDGYAASPCGSARGDIAYTYDEADSDLGCFDQSCATGHCGLGRLTRISEHSTGSTTLCYDIRGRRVSESTAIIVNGQTTIGQMAYTYDTAGHVTRMTYPDGEVVKYSYDGVGQVKSVKGAARYVKKLTYDVFGRTRVLAHGNGTIDTRTYAGAAGNFRLAAIDTAKGHTPLLSYAYTAYLPTGMLSALVDAGPKGVTNSLDNTATVSYDALGRIAGVTGPNLPYANGYAYDALGNMTRKEGTTLSYGSARPHTLAQLNGSGAGIAHDANGNRTAKPGQTYAYDGNDRLTAINGGTVRFIYDYTGQRVAKISGTNVTRYYGKWAEASAGYLTKYYFAAGMLVASQRVPNTELAGVTAGAAVQLTDVAPEHPALVLYLRRDVQRGVLVAVGVLGSGLLFAPWRRKRVVGIAVRHGRVIGILIVFSVASLPLPLLVRPAGAITPGTVVHYHLDHLGSTQVITDRRGNVVAYMRYTPYGELRGHYDQYGNALGDCGGMPSCREFTGYDTEPVSGLQYAGARFYDPQLGMFLTHDPARQFANPYCYTGWNPTNLTDPHGEFIGELLAAIVIAAAVSAAVNTVIAAAQGASLSQIGHAAAMGAVTGAVGAGLGVVASGVGIGVASLAGTLPQNVGLNQALSALGEVAYRSALSGAIANAAGQTAAAAGAPEGAVIGISIAAGYAGSYVYDSNFINPRGDLARIESKGDFQQTSNTATHTNTTHVAAREAGFSQQQAVRIVRANLARDSSLVFNMDHFDFGAQQAFSDFAARAGRSSGVSFLDAIGAASHHLQDQYALGHILPGTHLIGSDNRIIALPLALLRGFVHQTIGGEVTFREAQYEATLNFLRNVRPI
jgi:RHS repeat-associated protein